MITLHHLENSQSIKILWLMEELGLDYDFKFYERDKATMLAPADYKKLSPLGTAPCITDGDLVLSESNAIIDYILEKYAKGRLRPSAEDPAFASYLSWFHSSQGSIQPIITMNIMLAMVVARSPFILRPLLRKVFGLIEQMVSTPRMEAILVQMEKDLSRHDWLAGDEISAADIAMIYCIFCLPDWGGMDDRYPNAQAYCNRVKSHPSFRRAMEIDPSFVGVPPLT